MSMQVRAVGRSGGGIGVRGLHRRNAIGACVGIKIFLMCFG